MPDQNIGRVDIGRREQRMQPAGYLVGGNRGAGVPELRALAEADAIVEHDAREGCDLAGNQFPSGGVVAKARFEDARGASLADRFNGPRAASLAREIQPC
jgi:hypothetical protein